MIESVGVTQFVLCDARNTNVVLRVELPNEIMQMAQQHRHVLNTLDVLCHHPKCTIAPSLFTARTLCQPSPLTLALACVWVHRQDPLHRQGAQ